MKTKDLALKNRLKLVVVGSVATVSLFMTHSASAADTAAAAASSIVITRTQNPQTQEPIEIVAQTSSAEQLAKTSPAELEKKNAAYRQQILAECSGKSGVLLSTAKNFLPEASAFYTGVAASAFLQMKNDPAAIEHFYQNNLNTVTGNISFAFFMIGSRLTTDMLTLAGLNFDPCHEAKFRTAHAEKGYLPTPLQRRFGYLVGPLAMTGGFFLSTMASDLLSDPNLKLCASGMIHTLSAEDQQKSTTACETAYQSWVSTGKIVGYVPDLLSMTITSVGQALFVNLPVGLAKKQLTLTAEKFAAREALGTETRATQIFLRSFQIATRASIAGGPVVRFAVQAGSAAIFVSVNNYILPHIKTPFETWRQGRDITSSINSLYSELGRIEKNNWVWTEAAKPIECGNLSASSYADQYFVPPLYCFQDTPKVDALVTGLNDKYKKWRDTLLADAYLANSNWKEYLLSFVNTYQDSKRFYSNLAKAIVWKRTPGASSAALVEKLYGANPDSYVAALEKDKNIITQESKDQHAANVALAKTDTMSDFLLASMVCGPDILTDDQLKAKSAIKNDSSYAQDKPGLIKNLFYQFGYSFADTNHSDNTNSMIYLEYDEQAQTNALVDQIFGIRADFRPPRVVNIPNKIDVCRTIHLMSFIKDPLFDIHTAQVTVDGETTTGFINIVKRFFDPSILGRDQNSYNFNKWWASAVDAHVLHVVDLFRKDFSHIVQTSFIPKITNQETKIYNGRKFELGVGTSMEAQAHLNLVLLSKAYFPKNSSSAQNTNSDAHKAFMSASDKFLKHLHLQIALLGDTGPSQAALQEVEKIVQAEKRAEGSDSSDAATDDTSNSNQSASNAEILKTDLRFQTAFEANANILNKTLETLAAAGEANQASGIKPEAQESLKALAQAAKAGLASLVTETGGYFGIVDTIRVDGLD